MKNQSHKYVWLWVAVCILILVASTGILHVQADTSPAVGPNYPPIDTITNAKPPRSENRGGWSWHDGNIVYSTILTCNIWTSAYGTGTYVGYEADPDNLLPKTGMIYYVHVIIYGVGNPCAGTYALVEIKLPPNTSLAISATTPVYCFFDGNDASGSCPQSLPLSTWDTARYNIPSPGANKTWPLAQGHFWEFQVPVRTSTVLSGSNFQAAVWSIDGNSSPWLYPTAPIYVYGAPKPGAFNKTSPVNNAINKPTTLTLYWGSSSNAAKYEYCIDKVNDGKCNATWKSTGLVRKVTLSGLLKNTKYYWQVRAKNSGGTTLANGGKWWNFKTKP